MKMLIGSLALILAGGLADVAAADPPAKLGLTLEPVADEAELHQLMQKNMAQVQLRHRAMVQLMKEEGDPSGDPVQARTQTRTQSRKQLQQTGAGDGMRSAMHSQRRTEDSLEAKLQHRYRHREQTSTGNAAGSGTQARKRGR